VNTGLFSTALLYYCVYLIVILRFSISLQVLHFCICKFVSVDKANLHLSAETKLHVQKYDGLDNREPKSRIGGNSGFKYRHNIAIALARRDHRKSKFGLR
jgi:hypothetical protein